MIEASLLLAFIGPGGPEILVVMLALLVMFGAKDAPRIFRKLNDILNQIRSTADHFKREVMYSDITTDTPPSDPVGEYDDYGLAADEAEAAEPGEEGDTDPSDDEQRIGEDHDKPL